MFITMMREAYAMFTQYNMIPEQPRRAFNVDIVTILLIDFLKDTANDFETEHICEIVRYADQAGVKLEPRDEVEGCTADDIE